MAGLLNYPVLQAADILLYRADVVPVGEDQVQHLELSRVIARNWNSRFSPEQPYFPEPQARLTPTRRIVGLDGQAKMSKSLGNTIGLLETPDAIWDEAAPRRDGSRAPAEDGPGRPREVSDHLPAPQGVLAGSDRARGRDELPYGGVGLHRLQEVAPGATS